ncbi:MAG: methyltransferase domain-containing protein [Actinomycetales bacterium]|nr:methyltransferase domain-containing protein [Actinomycetales bacterium]
MTTDAPGAIPSPNIWTDPAVYEVHNLALDRAGVIEATILRLAGLDTWAGVDVLEVGCGTGFHVASLARAGARVVGIEPHAPLVELAAQRISGMPSASVRLAGAAATGLPDGRVDVALARWAYFFGPGCEPGLVELARVVRPGGVAVVVDNDATRSTFGSWFSLAWPDYDPAAVQRFWRRQGWHRESVQVAWRFTSRPDFEAVLRLEFERGFAEALFAAEPTRTTVDYAVNLWWRRF